MIRGITLVRGISEYRYRRAIDVWLTGQRGMPHDFVYMEYIPDRELVYIRLMK